MMSPPLTGRTHYEMVMSTKIFGMACASIREMSRKIGGGADFLEIGPQYVELIIAVGGSRTRDCNEVSRKSIKIPSPLRRVVPS